MNLRDLADQRLDQLAGQLQLIYEAEFAGKRDQRFLILGSDLARMYKERLHASRIPRLQEIMADEYGLYLFDLGETNGGRMFAVIRAATVDRWRKVTRAVVISHLISREEGDDFIFDDDEIEEDDDEEETDDA